MLKAIRRFFGEKGSGQIARQRMQVVLMHDRMDLTPAELNSMKDEILEVISRHVDIDSEAVQIAVEHDGRNQRLVADIPLRSLTRRRAG